MNKKERDKIKDIIDKTYEEYRFSKERADNIHSAERRNRLTGEELHKQFTI